jgi:hypothetical protein
MKRLPVVLPLLICLLLAGCGGDDGDSDAESGIYDDAGESSAETAPQDTQPQAQPPGGTDDARSLARRAAVALESCYAETQDYSQCDSEDALDDPGLTLADPAAETPEPGQAQIPEAGPDEYTIKTVAEDGTLFTLAGSAGAMSRICAPPGQSGCGEDGSW